MKIDIFNHLIPRKYYEALSRHLGKPYPAAEANPGIIDLDLRFRIMDKYDDLVQVPAPGGAPIEAIADEKKSPELARIANDAMAEVIHKYPDRFLSAVAMIPTNNVEAALEEIDRAVNDLKFSGIYLFTPQYVYSEISEKEKQREKEETPQKGHTVGRLPDENRPLDSPYLMPIYEKMAQMDLPIWIHPRVTPASADYTTEKRSKYRVWQIFGWPFHTNAAMARLVFSGIFDKYPNIKFLTHHAGAMVPLFEGRITAQYDYDEKLFGGEDKKGLKKEPIDYFRMFYCDTAVNGATQALMAAYSFYGAEKMVFGTDMPHDCEFGDASIRETIRSMNDMDITRAEKQLIFEENAKKLLRLSI